MILGYDVERVATLRRHTTVAVGGIRRLHCSDAEAALAMSALRRVADHLESYWIPFLDQLVGPGTQAGVMPIAVRREWDRTNAWMQTAVPAHLRSDRWTGSGPTRYRSMSDDELLGEVYHDGLEHSATIGWGPVDFSDVYWDGFAELAAELSRRVAADPRFADQLVERIHLSPLVAFALRRADFRPEFAGRVVIALLTGPQIEAGALHRLHREALDASMRTLLCLDIGAVHDVLADADALHTLATWHDIDDALLERFVGAGLDSAVRTGRRSLSDGLDVIELLVDLSNGPLEGGMPAGMARAVAASMFTFAHPIAHGIGSTDDHASVFRTDPEGYTDGRLASFADVRDFFGAVLRDPDARATLAVVLGTYAATTVERLGERIFETTAADDPVVFGHLLASSVAEERYEIEMATIANEARRARLGNLIAFAGGTVAVAVGVPTLVRKLAERAVRLAATSPTDEDDDTGEAPSLAEVTRRSMIVGVLDDLARQRESRTSERFAGLDEVTTAQWNDLERRLSRLAELPPGRAADEEFADLVHHLQLRVPALDRLLVEAGAIAGMDQLRFGGRQRHD